MGGQDRLKGKILRIGHLGAISDEDQLHALAAIGLSAIDLGWSSLTMEKVDLALATADQALRTNE
jgi:aspartate aminotransferase-like enzyme